MSPGLSYVVVQGSQSPVATPVFSSQLAGRHWVLARRGTVKAASLRQAGEASLLLHEGDSWRLVHGSVCTLDPLRPRLEPCAVADALLAPLALTRYARQNGVALASLWMKHPSLLVAVATARKVLLVLHPRGETAMDPGPRPAEGVYATRVGPRLVAVPVRRGDAKNTFTLSEDAAQAVEGEGEEACSFTTLPGFGQQISAAGSVTRGRGTKRGREIVIEERSTTHWDGVRTTRLPSSYCGGRRAVGPVS